MAEEATVTTDPGTGCPPRSRHTLRDAGGRLKQHALKLLGFVIFAYLILKLLPGLEQALEALRNVDIWWVVGAMAVETVSEAGYAISWRGILDPESLLSREGRGERGARVAVTAIVPSLLTVEAPL